MKVPLLSTVRASCRHNPRIAPPKHLIELATGVASLMRVGSKPCLFIFGVHALASGAHTPSKTSPLPFGGKQGLVRYSIPRRKRDGQPCQRPAMANGRCWVHGGPSTGPRTPAGLERSRSARLKHGYYARAAVAERAEARAMTARSVTTRRPSDVPPEVHLRLEAVRRFGRLPSARPPTISGSS